MIDNALLNLQFWVFSKGVDRGFCMWDRIGNTIQDLRSWLMKK